MEIKTSTGHMLMVLGILLFVSSLAMINDHASAIDVFRTMSGAIAALALIFVMKQ